jgi:hypothetical protein
LLRHGESSLRLQITDDLKQDLCVYLMAVAKSLERKKVVAKAFRGALSFALVQPSFAWDFSVFIEHRRKPLGQRIKQSMPGASEGQVQGMLDLLFGPVLYLSLIRQQRVSPKHISTFVNAALPTLKT